MSGSCFEKMGKTICKKCGMKYCREMPTLHDLYHHKEDFEKVNIHEVNLKKK